MPIHDHAHVSRISLTLLKPLLFALDASGASAVQPVAGLPMPCIHLPEIATVLCATPIQSSRMFRSRMVGAACELESDIVLARHGMFPETIDEVVIDAVMHRESPLDVFISMVGYRAEDGGYWLVPPAGHLGDCIRLDTRGLTIAARPPYRSPDEHADGVTRAAAETVRALRRSHRR